MDDDVRYAVDRAAVHGLSGEQRATLERVVFHAALLAGEGAFARATSHFVAAAACVGNGRSCLDAGAPVELLLEAPGTPSLGFAVRIGDEVTSHGPSSLPQALAGLVDDDDARSLRDAVAEMRPDVARKESTFGVWIARDARGATIALDVQASSAREAFLRAEPLLSAPARARLDRHAASLVDASPWALSVTVREGRVRAIEMRWLLHRHADPTDAGRAVSSASDWARMSQTLENVLGSSLRLHAHPFLVATRLDEDAPPRIATSAWSRQIDTEKKRARLVDAFEALCGPARQADATWRLLREAIGEGDRWAIGRGLESTIDERGEASLRAVLVPSPRCGAAATSASTHQPEAAASKSSSSELETAAPVVATPKRS